MVLHQSDDKQPQIMLDPARKKATGFAWCNTFSGTHEKGGASLKFGHYGSTRMACPYLQMCLEIEVCKALGKTRAWKIEDNGLLLLDDDKVLGRFKKESVSEITGAVWQWV